MAKNHLFLTCTVYHQHRPTDTSSVSSHLITCSHTYLLHITLFSRSPWQQEQDTSHLVHSFSFWLLHTQLPGSHYNLIRWPVWEQLYTCCISKIAPRHRQSSIYTVTHTYNANVSSFPPVSQYWWHLHIGGLMSPDNLSLVTTLPSSSPHPHAEDVLLWKGQCPFVQGL